MQQYKLHNILKSQSREVTGLTIPKEVAQFFSGCYFKIEIKKIGNQYGLFCTSVTYIQPTKEDVEKYDFSKCRV